VAGLPNDYCDRVIIVSPQMVRSLRSRQGISRTDLAQLVGVCSETVSRWELGKQRPRPEYRPRIAALRSKGRREIRRLLAEQKGHQKG
jgi:DNA-binding transcriptional regulator YiaG